VPVPPNTGSGIPPDPGPYVPSLPKLNDPRKRQFERGMKFANAPGGKADLVVHGGPRVYHINSVGTVQARPISDLGNDIGNGVVTRPAIDSIPETIKGLDSSTDDYGNHVYFFTGPKGPQPGPTTLNNGLARYYPLSSSGIDVVGGFNGYISGPSPEYRVGHVGAQALYLGTNIANDFTAAGFKPADMSVSFWMYAEGTLGGYTGLVGNFTDDWQLWGNGTNANFYHSNNNNPIVASTTALSVGVWHNIVLTRTANVTDSQNKIYVDGVIAVSYTGPAGPTGGAPLGLNIACRYDHANITDARFQDVAMYSRVITSDEVLELWNNGDGKVYPFV